MVTSCCVYNCTNRAQKNTSLTFHTFPKNAKLRAEWVRGTWRKNFTPTLSHRVCSAHFRDEDYKPLARPVGNKAPRRRLIAGAAPSLVDLPGRLPQTQQRVPSPPPQSVRSPSPPPDDTSVTSASCLDQDGKADDAPVDTAPVDIAPVQKEQPVPARVLFKPGRPMDSPETLRKKLRLQTRRVQLSKKKIKKLMDELRELKAKQCRCHSRKKMTESHQGQSIHTGAM